jgi:hypothetical protein
MRRVTNSILCKNHELFLYVIYHFILFKLTRTFGHDIHSEING